MDNIENMKKQQPSDPFSVSGYYVDQWVEMDAVARQPYVVKSGVSDPHPHVPSPTPPPKPEKGYRTFSADKKVMTAQRRKQCGVDTEATLQKLWAGTDVAGRRGWALYEGTQKTPVSSAVDAPSPPTPEQIRALYLLRQHLAALRISAFFRVHTKMMLDVQSCARAVYREMGWGWNEKAYQEATKMELDLIGYRVTSEIPHTIYYKGRPMGDGVNVRSDILVEHRTSKKQLLLELKAVPASKATMEKAVQQCRRYLLLKRYPAGMVLNFPQQCGERVRVMKILL